MHKGFVFRFEKLLNHKIQQEEASKIQLAEAMKERDLVLDGLEDLKRQYQEAVKDWHEALDHHIMVSEIQKLSDRIQWVTDFLHQQRQKLLKAEEVVEKCRQSLVETKKETKKFEKIKEKDFALYQEELQKIEASNTDQFVSYRSATK